MSMYVIVIFPGRERNNEQGLRTKQELSTFTQPTDYPAALLKSRVDPPKYLYMAAPEAEKVATSLGIPQYGRYSEYTKSNIEAYLERKLKGEHRTYGLVSTYGNENTALKCVTESKASLGIEKSSALALCMKGIVPGWLVVGKGVYIPAWVEQKMGIRETMRSDGVWVCLEEASIVLGIDKKLGEKDEWLAYQPVVRRKISKSTTVPDGNGRKAVARVLDEEYKEEADEQARRQRGTDGKKGEERDQASHAKLRRDSSTSSPHPPRIPARRSSLHSLSREMGGETETSADLSPKLKVTTRDATISLTNADQHRATSLMKYALLVAHGKRVEAEENWLLDMLPLNESLSRAGSLHTIGEEDVEEDGEIRHEHAPEAATMRHITRSESLRTSSRWDNDFDLDDDKSSGRTACLVEDTDSVLEEHGRTKRSTAPSPSQSMLGHNAQENQKPLFPSRRSRRELLLELQSDEDSLLREYARVSLQASGVLDTQGHVEQDNRTASHAKGRAPQHDDVAEYNEPPYRERRRLAASAYLTPSSQSAIYTTPQTAQTSSTLVDTPPSLYVTPPSFLQTPPSPRQSGTPSKSEALMARGKGLREKGK